MWDRFLRACRREPVDCTPVWFMRQAGRYMAEYRAVRQKHSLLQICRHPELAAEVTLQPLRLGVDAAILFADILLPLEPMGAPFEFTAGEGPRMLHPVTDERGVDRLQSFDVEQGLGFVLEALRIVRKELDGKTPLIGFAGAPFTLASYLVEGGKSTSFAKTKRLMFHQPAIWHRLLKKLAEVVHLYLKAQIEAGAQAVQLFDSWVGALSPVDYEQFVQPHTRRVLEGLEKTGVPVIHFGTGTAGLLERLHAGGGSVIGIDWRVNLGQAWQRLGPGVAIQGNLDPLLLGGPTELLHDRVLDVLREADGRQGHVFNVGHGVLPETDPDNVRYVVDLVHESTAK